MNRLLESGRIEFWAFCRHLPDADDAKEHNHIFMIPARMTDTANLVPEFNEPDPIVGIPRRCKLIFPSKWGDWYLYVLHDREYLKAKGQERNVHYSRKDVICSDEDSADQLINEIDVIALKGFANMLDNAVNGVSFTDALIKGIIPQSRITQWSGIYKSVLAEQILRRNEKNGGYDV